MEPEEPTRASVSPEPAATADVAGVSAMADKAPLTPVARGRLWVLTLLAGLLVGVGAWLIGESGLVQFRPGTELVSVMGGEIVGASPRARALAALQSTSATFGIFGGLLGLALGVVGGRALRPARWSGFAAAVGLVLGAVAGAVPPWIVLPLSGRFEDLSGADLGRSVLIHAGLWVALGAAAGLALGLGLGGRTRAVNALIGGALGTLVGIVIYDLVGGLAFPLAGTGLPIATTPLTRLLAHLLVALGAVVGAAALVTADPTASRRRHRPDSRPEPGRPEG